MICLKRIMTIKEHLKRINLKVVALSIIAFSVIFPVVMACFYGLPAADDFSNARGWIIFQGNHLKYVFENMIKVYMNWQGTYFGAFLAGIPIYYMWGYIGLRLCMFINVALFLFSCYLFTKYALKWFGITENTTAILLLYTIGMVYQLCNNNLDETFYWYTGICVYTLPLSCMLLCFSCYIAYEEKKENKFLILGCILAFFAAGGSLNVAALLCAVLLFGVVYNCIVNCKIEKNVLIGGTALLGAVINTVAPGNFVRHLAFDEKISPIRVSFELLTRINEILSFKIKEGFLLMIFLVGFLWANKHLNNSNKKFKYPVLVSMYAYLAIFITDFPTALGYSQGYVMPERCTFVENLAIVIFVTLCALYWGGWSAQKQIFHFTAEITFVIAIICIMPLSSYLNLSTVKELIPYKMMWHMAKGDYRRVCETEENIIKQIENAQEEDVVIYFIQEDEGEWTNLKKIGIDADPDFWVNRAVAEYYDVKTVSLQYTDE